MGDAAVGLITMHHYNADLDNAENKRFVAAWKKDYGANTTPDFMAVGGYDGMALIVHVVQQLKGKIDADKALAAAKTFKFNSPRGPISIDPDTRDIVMNEYLSEVVKGTDGKLHAEGDRQDRQREGCLQGAEDRALRLIAFAHSRNRQAAARQRAAVLHWTSELPRGTAPSLAVCGFRPYNLRRRRPVEPVLGEPMSDRAR